MKTRSAACWARTLLGEVIDLLRRPSPRRLQRWKALILLGLSFGKLASLRLFVEAPVHARTRLEFLESAVRAASLPGLWLEFGVARGDSINFIAAQIDPLAIHGFDSFFGLPEDWNRLFRKGAFSLQGALPAVRQNVTLHVGLFQESLPAFLLRTPGIVAFAHIDSDLYSSASFVLDRLSDRLSRGTVLAFDEFITPSPMKNEAHAFSEFLHRTGWKYEGVATHVGEMGDLKVAVRIR